MYIYIYNWVQSQQKESHQLFIHLLLINSKDKKYTISKKNNKRGNIENR